MMFGVMVTSFLIENFLKVLNQLKNFNQTFNDSQNLTLFIGTLKMFNRGVPSEASDEYSKFFKYRWQKDRNLAV